MVVHEEDQPRGVWRLGIVQDLIVGADGCVRGAVVRVPSKKGRSTTLRRPIQHLYPLEMNSKATEPRQEAEAARNEPNPEVDRPAQHPRRAAAVEVDRKRRLWIDELT